MKITRKGFLLGSGAALLGLGMPKLSWSLSDFSIDAAALPTQDPYSPSDILIFNKNNTGLQTTYGSGLRAQTNGYFGPFCLHDTDYGSIIEAEITCPSSAASWHDPLFVVAMVRTGPNAGNGVGLVWNGDQIFWGQIQGNVFTRLQDSNSLDAYSNPLSIADGDTLKLIYDRSTGTLTARHNNTSVLTHSGGTVTDLTYAGESSLAAGFGFNPQNLNQRAISLFSASGVATAPAWLLPPSHSVPAKQAMKRIYPRPDSETQSFARHRKAFYDGAHPMPYRIPVGVSFGRFPYRFQLTQGPSGMTIGETYGSANYGVITWTPGGPLSNETVTVLVTDQDSNQLTISWTVSTSASTADFIFVDDANGSDTSGTGALGSPYQTLEKAFGSTFATQSHPGAICYLRAGTYELPAYLDNDIIIGIEFFEMDTARKPSALIGYPGETATLDLTTGRFATQMAGSDMFMQDLSLTGYMAAAGNYRFFVLGEPAGCHRMTFDGLHWTGAGYGTGGGDNASMFFAGHGSGSYRDYIYVRDCSDNGRSAWAPNSYALCCFFSVRNSLVELCSVVASECDGAIYFKGTNVDCTARGNSVNVANLVHALSTGFAPNGAPDRIEICYNTIITDGVVTAGTEPNDPYGEHWFYRNTLVGPWLRALTPDVGGPYVFENNVVVTDASPIVSSGTSVTNTGTECQGATSLGIVDAAGKLAGTYRTNYLGLRGAEIA